LLLTLLPLCGCGLDRTTESSVVADEDYRVRHPLVLTHQELTLDIFPEGQTLDSQSRARIKEFASNYRGIGEGPVTILVPQGAAHDEIARRSVGAIRQSLVAGGIRGPVGVRVYPVPDAELVAPVRISFVGLKAQVASRCGQWPDDLAADGWENHPFWNQGCSYQSAFAAQVADPRDLVAPRAEQPSDLAIRTRAIGDVRQGNDPSTKWTVQNSDIGQLGNAGGQ
jgi:pilus assembly protein CpaD